MASKLTLTFFDYGVVGETLTIAIGKEYHFVISRTTPREVTVSDMVATGTNFRSAFQTDDNYLGEFTLEDHTNFPDVSEDPEDTPSYVLSIEHPDNSYFDNFVNNTTFVTSSITTTEQEVEPTMEAAFGAALDPCGDYKLILTPNKTSGTIYVEQPIGVDVAEIILDGSPSYEVEIPRPSTAQTAIAKYFQETRTTRGAAEILFNPPPVLSITSVTVEGTPFGGIATINATSGLTLQYSLTGTDWTGGKQFGSLLAGNYTAYAKDEFGCQKTKSFIVTEDQVTGLSVPPYIEVPKHNAMHFVDRRQNNFLGQIAEEITANAPISFCQDWVQSDVVPTQFRSSHKVHTVTLYGCGTQKELTVLQKSDNINRVNIYEGNYTGKNGRLAVYFTSGNIYNSDGTPKAEGHILNGRLPTWYKNGMYIHIEGVGVTQIERILEEDNSVYAITELPAAGTVLSKEITSIHSEHPYEIFEFDVQGTTLEGNYIVEIDYGGTHPFISEVQRFQEELNHQYLRVSWWNNELNDHLFYGTGIKPFRRMKYDRYFNFKGENEREIHATDTSIKLIRSKSKAVYELDFRPSNMETARGLINGLNHANHIDINGAVFICNSAANTENFGNWYFVKTELALIGQSMESIEADLTQINVEFLKVVDDASGVGFLQV